MFPLGTLFFAALPLLVLSTEPEQCSSQTSAHHNSPVLASLQCYNDFTTQMRCSWEEEPHTHLHMPISERKPCVPDVLSKLQPNGKRTRSCIYKTSFSMGKHDVFFNTSCPSKVTTFNMSAEGKVLSPTNFSEKKEIGGDRLLSWSSPYPSSSPLTQNLTYQLKYRRHNHDWLMVNDISDTKFVIESQALLPAYLYEAKVRARGPVGLWSDWSPTLFWMNKEEGVINLQCVIKELGVTCSWLVKKRQAEFLSYHLCGQVTETSVKCNLCDSHTEHPHFGTLLVFTCSLDSSKAEQLTVEVRSIRKAKRFQDPDNIQPPRPYGFSAYKQDGVWKLKWTRPGVDEKLRLFYQVCLESNDTKEKVEFNLSEADFSTRVPSSLQPSTGYMARVRAVPGYDFAGRPSDWSDPAYFTTDPAPWIDTIIYVLIAAVVAVLFMILFNALPACHRRLVLWKVSIPSPINSKVLGEINSKKFLAGETKPYIEKEKTCVFIIQTSDNPIIYKGSISEYPLLKCSKDVVMGLDMSESGWPQSLSHSSLFKEGSRMTDKSGVSFSGPYILCREDSSLSSETSDTFFSPLLTLKDDDERCISDSIKDPFSIKGGYVLSPPKNSTLDCITPVDNLASQNREARRSKVPDDDPPAYTSSPTAHPSGYCLMPNMESAGAWVSAAVLPPEGNTERKLHELEDDSPEHSYVTLSQRGMFQ